MLIIYKDVLCSHAMRLIQYAYRSYSVCSPFIYFFCRQSEHRHEKIYLVKLKIRVLAKEQKQILFTLHGTARDNLQNKIDVWYVLTPMVTFCM